MLISSKKSVQFLQGYCKQQGIKQIVVCPGSRNIPLILSFSNDPFFNCISILDERVAGFIALGLAKSSQKPVVVITTSGSAAINLSPAIAEAFYQHIPIIAVTADRPSNLINKGENQTIIQRGLFKNFIELELEIEESIVHANFESLILEAHHALNLGPVHLNFPFSEPLLLTEHILGDFNFNLEFKTHLSSTFSINPLEFKDKNILIYLSTNDVSKELSELLSRGIEVLNWVVIAELNSNFYHKDCIYMIDKAIIINPDLLKPDILITIGEQILSKKARLFFKSIQNLKHLDLSTSTRNWNSLSIDYQCFCVNELEFISKLYLLNISNKIEFTKEWTSAETNALKFHNDYFDIEKFSEFFLVQNIINSIEPNATFYWGNSSLVRYASWVSRSHRQDLTHLTNRGVSGIDGVLASAIGYQLDSKSSNFYVILGDLSLFYETNALQSLSLIDNIKLIVFNNQGGKIFDNIHDLSDLNHTNLVLASQNINIEKLVLAYDIQYIKSNDLISFSDKFQSIYSKKGKYLLELEFQEGSNSDWKKYFAHHN